MDFLTSLFRLFTFGKVGNLQKNNKKEKKEERKRNSAGQGALTTKPNTLRGPARPGADLSCLWQYIRPGP